MAIQKLDEEVIFHAARQIEAPDARARYLDEVCGQEKELQARVEALLHVHDEEKSFLEQPGVPTRATANEGPVPFIDLWATGASNPAGCPGTVIGPYKLMEQIGEG